jgi:uncharacterized protein DUF6982
MPPSPLRDPEPGSDISKIVRLSDHRAKAHDEADNERRIHTRHVAGELPWLDTIRLKYGPALSLLDLSSGGVQIELEAFRLRPGSTVVVEIVGHASQFTVPSRVLRCQVTGIAPLIRYRSALEFKRVLDLPDVYDVSSIDSTNDHDANPLHAHARLAVALGRLDSPLPGEARIVSPHAAARDSWSAVGADAMAAALAMLDTPAGRRAGQSFASELSRLFGEVARGIDRRESSEELTRRIEERLRRAIPARIIRITGASPSRPQQGSDIVYFDTPSAPSSGAPRILVEFARDTPPHEWQFQLLKASAHLVTLVREVEERRRSVEQPDGSPAPDDDRADWNKIVARYADGRMLKGYCQDFHAPRGHFQLWPSPKAPAESRVTVPIGYLKAVFFVRDFAGNSEYQEDTTIVPSGGGRKVAITFLDDELLVGTTLDYRPDDIGFFVLPNDPKSNNIRTFVFSRAVRHVRFL